MRSFFDESWTVTFVCLASRHQSRISSSTEKRVLRLGIMAQSIPSVLIPPCICWAFQFNSIQFNFIYTFIKYSHYIYEGRNTLIKEEKKKEKRKLMAWIEVYGGQGA